MKRLTVLLLVLAVAVPAVAAGAAAARPSPTATSAAFAKSKFVFDVGTASYAIHHFIYAPYKSGQLHGVKADLKAAAAALYAVHALRGAYAVANSGNSKLLHLIVRPLNALIATAGSLASGLRHGKTSGVTSANSQLGTLSSVTSHAGVPFADKPVSV